jgi:hypothetical protein
MRLGGGWMARRVGSGHSPMNCWRIIRLTAAVDGRLCDKQKCLVHLLREFHDCAKRDASKEYQKNYKKIKRLINDALRLREQNGHMNKIAYLRRVAAIKQRLFDFMTYPHRNKNLNRLSKRFSKFWLDMFTFLQDPKIAWNNNLAERMIRPNVIYRNRSFGNRSLRGAEAHATLMSLIQTLTLRKQDAKVPTDIFHPPSTR